MSKVATYVFHCDAASCANVTPPQENDYKMPEGWSQLNVIGDGGYSKETLHFCPRCTGAIKDGFLQLHEEEN